MVEAFANNISSTLKHHLSYTLVTPPLELTVAKSGFAIHFLPATCPCDNKVAVLHGVKRVHMPNGETMVVMHTALLPFPQIPLFNRKCDVFSEFQQPLLSLGQFCDAGFTSTLNSETVQLTKDGSATLLGKRDHNNGLYFINLQG